MSIKKFGKKLVILGGAITTIGAVIIAAPIAGPVGAIVIAGAAITESVMATAAVTVAVGSTIVALSED